MPRLRASLLLALVLVVSLGAKGMAFRHAENIAPPPDANELATFLRAGGFEVSIADYNTAPIWVTGVRGTCVVRIADVAPQGWFRSIVSQQGEGLRVNYAFAGQLYADQPVALTILAEYRQRLLRYFGLVAPPPRVRAILVSPACSPGTLDARDAAVLS